MFLTFHIVGPLLVTQIWYKTTCKAAPVALTQQRIGQHRQPVLCSNIFSCLYSTAQVTGYDYVNRLFGQPLSDLTSLFPTPFVEVALHLSLHDLPCVVIGLAMTHQVNCCLHEVQRYYFFVTDGMDYTDFLYFCSKLIKK